MFSATTAAESATALSATTSKAALWHLKLLAFHLFEFLLLIAGQNIKHIAFHVPSHLFHFLTDTVAASAGEQLTHAFSHLFHQACLNFLKLFLLSIGDFQLLSDFRVAERGNALKLNVDFLQTLQLLREQNFFKLFLHFGGSFLSLLPHLREEFSSLVFAHISEVAARSFGATLFLHFGQGFFLIR